MAASVVEQSAPIVQPDVIPQQIEQSVPPPAEFKNTPTIPIHVVPELEPEQFHAAPASPVVQEQEIYANVQKTADIQKSIETSTVVESSRSSDQPIAASATVVPTESVQELYADPIYQNQEDLSEYIEDTGIRAIALYDYQAAADDEISFDPDDVITHIEQVIF